MPATLPSRRRDDRGASTIELAMYMPILLFVIFLAVQFSLVYLGNQAASAVAREASRVARTGGSPAEAEAAGRRYADNIGGGILNGAVVDVRVDGDSVRVVVRGRAQEISPVGVPTVRQTIEGPLEQFVGAP